MSAHPARPAPAASAAGAVAAPAASPAIAPAGGSAYRNSSPAMVPASMAGEYLSWMYADLATMCQRLASFGYGRTLTTWVDRPSQVRPRPRLMSRPRATSSMRAPLIATSPPDRSRASRRTSMQPPAAAAVREPGALTRRNG